jgi:hypothetical protein
VGRGPQERPSAMSNALGSAFDVWFARACAINPHARFATCSEQVDALAEALSGVSPARNLRYLRGVATIVAAGGLAVAGWRFGVIRHQTRPPVSLPAVTGAPGKTATITTAPVAHWPPAVPPPSPATERAAERTPLAISTPSRRASRASKRLDAPRGDAEPAAPKPATPSDHIWDEP